MKLFNKKNFSKGFTLIELLLVIGIIGILAAGILIAIDPVDKINSANDAKVQNDASAVGKASEAYAITHKDSYPPTLDDLLISGEIKTIPVAPAGYTYEFTVFVPPCPIPIPCRSITFTSDLKSKRFTTTSPPGRYWRYESSSGRSCAVAARATPC